MSSRVMPSAPGGAQRLPPYILPYSANNPFMKGAVRGSRLNRTPQSHTPLTATQSPRPTHSNARTALTGSPQLVMLPRRMRPKTQGDRRMFCWLGSMWVRR